MKKWLFCMIATLVFVAGAEYVFAGEAKCSNPVWLENFPGGWNVEWERKIPLKRDGIEMDALVVREYHFREGAIAKYYRADYPGYLGAEAVYIEGPGTQEIVNGKLHFNFSEQHFFFRHLHLEECWREVEEFDLVADINTIEKDLEFFIYWKEFGGKPRL